MNELAESRTAFRYVEECPLFGYASSEGSPIPTHQSPPVMALALRRHVRRNTCLSARHRWPSHAKAPESAVVSARRRERRRRKEGVRRSSNTVGHETPEEALRSAPC